MDGYRCPECQNDISETIDATLIELIKAGKTGTAPMQCPHCGTELSVAAQVTATLSRQA